MTFLTAMTFNIRCDGVSEKNPADLWAERKARVVSVICDEAPDLLVVQEARVNQFAALKAALGETHDSYGVGRKDGIEESEAVPVFFKKDRFMLLEARTRWCSPTPDVPSSGWDAAFPRTLSELLLFDRHAGAVLVVIGVHFDHRGQEAREEYARIGLQDLRHYAPRADHFILMGDMNTFIGSAPWARLQDAPISQGVTLRDAASVTKSPRQGPGFTFNGFDPQYRAESPIDFIFVDSRLSVEAVAVIDRRFDGCFASDHFAVKAHLKLPGGAQ